MSKIKVTQLKSTIRRPDKQKRTIVALGLGKINGYNVLPDNAQTRGMLEVVKHLVNFEVVSE